MMYYHKILYIFIIIFILSLYLQVNLNVKKSEVQEISKNFLGYAIRGFSMEPTFKDGEQVSVDLDYYKTHDITRGDIVAFKLKTQEKPFVKRVIALPGDKLEFSNDGNIYINGEKLEESYLADKAYHFDPLKLRVFLIPLSQTNNIVPEGTVMVLGDNRRNSFDSKDYGFVAVEYIIGKVTQSF